jgi:Methylaspartate mutase E chain (MutE)
MQAGARKHTIALGGIGGAAHSVGLTILRHALSMSDYHVHYLSTQNELNDFLQIAPHANIVMISTFDGHGRYYLRGFPELIRNSKLMVHCEHGSLATSVVHAFHQGFLDVPFSPSIHNRGEVVTARDAEGAVRFVSTGQLQFDRE